MLSIKDNVDLKELIKYGFKETEEGIFEFRNNEDYSTYDCSEDEAWLFTADIDRELLIVIPDESTINTYKTQRVLYDLIKDGLVEKNMN